MGHGEERVVGRVLRAPPKEHPTLLAVEVVPHPAEKKSLRYYAKKHVHPHLSKLRSTRWWILRRSAQNLRVNSERTPEISIYPQPLGGALGGIGPDCGGAAIG